MNENYPKALKWCLDNIGIKPNASEAQAKIDETIKMIETLKQGGFYTDVDTQKLKNELLTKYSTLVDNWQILEGRERREPWLKDFKNEDKSKWDFWKRYSEYLLKNNGFAPSVIRQLDDLTDEVLNKLFNPQRKDIIISKKGLVVGQVQSGKTANYTGLVCKAADAGFNMIVVLAGIHNNLRSQTQTRLDEGFLGFDTQYERAYNLNDTTKIGVGHIPGFESAIANSYTTSKENGDFRQGYNFHAPQPILLVVKKNASILRRLHLWLQAQSTDNKITDKSLLIIDDEADNASINTNIKDLDPTAINRHIRNILSLFNRSAYVGYTATPFANIFIEQNDNDLFPRDFIINIPAPVNYIGPEKVFGTSISPDDTDNDLLPIVCPINDYTLFIPQGHKKDDDKPTYSDIPESLKTAVKSFIVTCAIRIARGQGSKHNSMLIHISRFQAWQNHIKELVEDLFNYYKQEIEANDPTVLEEFREILEEDTANYNSYKTVTEKIKHSRFSEIDKNLTIHSWEEIKPLLYKAVGKIVVKSINGSSSDCLTYYEYEKTGISVIAIGGDKLSRGLTLEGLSVSYFLRASKMYDTLMQMGRWFGYRPGYVDLCRLYTSEELNEWFRHITIASEELRADFDYLASIKGTPEDYSLKVRNSPGQLQVTSASKMRYTEEKRVSWAGLLKQTYQLSMDRGIKKKNLIATDDFISALGTPEQKGNSYLWRGVSPDDICDYLSKFTVAENLKTVNLELICKYIKELVKTEQELTSWSVALISISEGENIKPYDFSNGLKVNCSYRKRATDCGTNNNTYYLKKNNIVNPTDELIDIDEDIRALALAETKSIYSKWKENYPSLKIVREKYRHRTSPLLFIYPLNPEYTNILDEQDNVKPGTITYTREDEPFIGFAIAFPSSAGNHAISYVSNLIKDFENTENTFDNENDNVYDEQ